MFPCGGVGLLCRYRVRSTNGGGVGVGAGVGVGVGDAVGVRVGDAVGVSVGDAVGAGVGVGVVTFGVGVGVRVGLPVGFAEGAGVDVRVGEAVSVAVGLAPGVGEEVGAAVGCVVAIGLVGGNVHGGGVGVSPEGVHPGDAPGVGERVVCPSFGSDVGGAWPGLTEGVPGASGSVAAGAG